jgi:hypothetical protein
VALTGQQWAMVTAAKTNIFTMHGILFCGEGVGNKGGSSEQVERDKIIGVLHLADVYLDVPEAKRGILAGRRHLLTWMHYEKQSDVDHLDHAQELAVLCWMASCMV